MATCWSLWPCIHNHPSHCTKFSSDPAVVIVEISDNSVPFCPFCFSSCSEAVKKYPKNRMLGQRQVSDGKVKQSSSYVMGGMIILWIFSEDANFGLEFRLVTMCGKRMRKCTRRSSRLEQPSEASALSRWVKDADLSEYVESFFYWILKCMAEWVFTEDICWYLLLGGSLWHIWIKLSRMGHGHAGEFLIGVHEKDIFQESFVE